MRTVSARRALASVLFLSCFGVPVLAGEAEDGYQPAEVVVDLYDDFVRSGGEDSIALALARALADEAAAEGPLVLVTGSGIFAYDRSDRSLIAAAPFREDPSGGSVELTAVSHVGPAIAYLARLAEAGGDWRPHGRRLLSHLRGVRAMNAEGEGAWLDGITSPAFDGRRAAVAAMIDYATYAAGSYLVARLSGEDAAFALADVKATFLDGGSGGLPIGYDAVMVGTFALATLVDAHSTAGALRSAGIDWSAARVVVVQRIGTNFGAGLTARTNWIVPLLDAVSGGALPEENVLIVPYADRREAIGSDPLPEDAFTYYDQSVWQALAGRVRVAEEAFAEIPAIPDAPARSLPGDWGVTDAGDLGAFMMRLRYTFARPTELLSNATGFWIAGALADADWDPAAVRLPGLEAGFPAGLSGYPKENPPIPALPTATD